jgi:hypothetical protein
MRSPFAGTLFRLALRTEEQSRVSKLSGITHTVGGGRTQCNQLLRNIPPHRPLTPR